MEDCCTVSITSIELLTETFPGKNDQSATTVLPLTITIFIPVYYTHITMPTNSLV